MTKSWSSVQKINEFLHLHRAIGRVTISVFNFSLKASKVNAVKQLFSFSHLYKKHYQRLDIIFLSHLFKIFFHFFFHEKIRFKTLEYAGPPLILFPFFVPIIFH